VKLEVKLEVKLVGAERWTVGRSNDRTRASVDGAVRAIKITPRASRAVTGVDARDDVLGGIARDDVRRRAAI
jgi:hypothetical protein